VNRITAHLFFQDCETTIHVVFIFLTVSVATDSEAIAISPKTKRNKVSRAKQFPNNYRDGKWCYVRNWLELAAAGGKLQCSGASFLQLI
jgi:hypothetical protein